MSVHLLQWGFWGEITLVVKFFRNKAKGNLLCVQSEHTETDVSLTTNTPFRGVQMRQAEMI